MILAIWLFMDLEYVIERPAPPADNIVEEERIQPIGPTILIFEVHDRTRWEI